MPEIKTVLFPTDFSEYSNKAFPYAASLARVFGARLLLLHIEEFLESDPANPRHSFGILDEFDGEIETERVLVRGYAPYRHILEVSREKQCDLIVMATHGRSALAQFFLGGSVAEEVARFSGIPVFIVKVDLTEPADRYAGLIKHILFTTDLSTVSTRAFPYATLFARKFAARLSVLHVIDAESSEYYKSIGLDIESDSAEAAAQSWVRDFVSKLPDSDAVSSIHVVRGRAAHEIERLAEESAVDLITIATYGHGGVKEEMVGSITDRVIRSSPCPVLAVRG